MRPEPIRWLGRAIAAVGLFALIAAALDGIGSGAPFDHDRGGIGQIEQALPAELRQGRLLAVHPDEKPARSGVAPLVVPDEHRAILPVGRAATNEAAPGGAILKPFRRPASQAPPVSI